MYKVVVVEDEEIVRKGIIFTINWEALNCMMQEKRLMGRRCRCDQAPFTGYHCYRSENAPYGWCGNDRDAAK